MRRPHATAADVAALAGVSTATVSMVVNGQAEGRVSEATALRVQRAIQELGYRVDRVAQSLSTGKRFTIGLVLPAIANPFFFHVSMGVMQALGSQYQLVLVNPDLDEELLLENVERTLSLGVDGLLISSPSVQLLRRLKLDCPYVLLDAPGGEDPSLRVNLDVKEGARLLAEHVSELGHKRVAYLDSIPPADTFVTRRRAFVERHKELSGKNAVVLTGESHASTETAGLEFQQRWPEWKQERVSLVVCATDIQAYGVLEAAQRLEMRIPDGLSLAAFDNLPFSAVTQPPLTSVAFPAADMGFQAASLLKSTIEGQEVKNRTLTLPASLKIRESTAQDSI